MNRRNILSQGFYDRTLLATISAVDPTGGYVSIMFLDQVGMRDKIPIPVVAMSKDAWIRFIPQVDDIVMVGLRPDDSAVILGWYPYNYGRRVSSFKGSETSATGGKNLELMQELKPGDVDMRGRGGGYLRFNNLGDVLLMSLGSRIQMYGAQSFTEVAQLGLKMTDGKSWFRFGAPFRSFPLISDRELPASGGGAPLNAPSDLRERDFRLYDGSGNLLVQESLGTVIDEYGNLELSGTSGAGTAQPKVSSATTTKFSSSLADPSELAKSLKGVADHVKETIKGAALAVQAGITAMITGASIVFTAIGKGPVFTQNIADTVADVQGIVTGAGAIAEGVNGIQGIGDIGKKLRYRIFIGKGGKPAAVFDIDEDGGIVLSSESPVGIGINTNKGSLSLFSKLGIKIFGKSFVTAADKVALTATNTLKLISGGKMSRAAGSDIADSARNITQGAELEAVYGAGSKMKIQCADAIVELTPGNVSIQTAGVVNINGGTVSITGATVTIN